MCEVLFRGKRIADGEWVYGFLLICDERYLIIPETKIGCVTTEWIKKGEYAFYGFVEVDPATVGRYTGFTDKKGKKIFEGDIVHNGTGDPGVVVWMYGSFAIHFSDGEDWDVCQYVTEEYTEVIGNIYDNPETRIGSEQVLSREEKEAAPAGQRRLIDANALKYTRVRIFHGMLDNGEPLVGGFNAVVMCCAIKDAPTVDAVEVVRCGECEYFHNLTCKIHKGSWGEQLKVGFSDFCSDGKRRL